MRLINKSALSIVLATSLALSSFVAQAWEKDKTYQITILHTNDHHGRFWQNDIGEYGLAAQKTVIDKIRQEVKEKGGSVLLLSAGDINTGVPESDLLNAEPDFKGMSKIGYDAMAIGNHEFDNPRAVLLQQQQWATFPFLSANIYKKDTNERFVQPYAIFDKQGVKVAVIGLTTSDTPLVSNPLNTQDLEFRDPIQETKTLIEQLRATEKPDVVVVTSHLGYYDDGNYGTAPRDVELAQKLPAGYLNLIVGGHSQEPVCLNSDTTQQANYKPATTCKPNLQNGTWIAQAHEWGKYVGRADFTFRNGELRLTNYQLIPINLMKEVAKEDGTKTLAYYTEKVPQDPEMLKLLTPFFEKGQEQLQVKIGSINEKLEGTRSLVRSQQTNMARMIIAAFMERTKADFGVLGGGNIRDSMLPGNITYKDVLKVSPFGNAVSFIDMKGKDIPDYLAVVVNKRPGSGAYAQLVNVSLTTDGKTVSNVTIKGQPLDPNKTYRLTTLDFMAAGGDGYPKIDNLPSYVNTGYVDAEVIAQYIKDHSPIDVNKFTPTEEIIRTNP